MTLLVTKQVHLSKEQFDKELEICLTIISYPEKTQPYYVCEYISAARYKSIVHVFVSK